MRAVTFQAPGEVRVLVTLLPPRPVERPGTFALGGAGSAAIVPPLSQSGTLEVLSPSDGPEVLAYSWPGLASRAVAGGAVAVPEGAGVVVVVPAGAGEGHRLRWSDPDWHDRSPRLGALLGVVVLALFVSLYRGAPGRSAVPLAARRRRG